MTEYAIVLDQPAFVRGKLEPEGSAFYINKTIGREEAQELVEEKKAKRVPIEEPKVVGGYLNEEA